MTAIDCVIRFLWEGCQVGASSMMSQAITAYSTSANAVITNGATWTTEATSATVLKALMAGTAMPMPYSPVGMPRLAGGNHEFTYGTPIAKVVPAMPRKNPPTRRVG